MIPICTHNLSLITLNFKKYEYKLLLSFRFIIKQCQY